MHSSRLGRLVVALLAVFALCAVAASAAQAEEAPFWSVKGARLGQGETRNIVGKVFSTNFTLTSAGGTVTCKALKLKEGVILGSNAGEPGTNDEIIEFTSCTVAGNGSNCKVTEPIVTTQVKSELVEDNATKKKLYVEFFPAKGVVFTTINFTGTCTVTSTKVEGEVAGEVLTDPGEAAVELPNSPGSAESWLIKFPATPIKEVWLIKGGTGATHKLTTLKAFALPATLTGTALVSLESKELWSPLP